jgi:cytochrome c oxidase cbb3-type subunit 3
MTTGELREHTFDGIQEFDNRLPNWWLWTFYTACLFSIGYWIWFHTLNVGLLPDAAYVKEQQVAGRKLEEAMARQTIDEAALAKMSANPALVDAGREIFRNPSYCAQCHGPEGNGIVGGLHGAGPNLTDNFWIGGGSAMDVYTTIVNGRPEKGMQSWKDKGPTFVNRVTAYVLSLRNTNVQGKPPEPGAVEYTGQ